MIKNPYDLFLKPIDHWLLQEHRKWLTAWATGKTLEIGIGTGLNLSYYPNNVQLTGIDHNQQQLKHAQEKADKLNMKINLLEMNAQQLPFEDESFDTVIMTFLLCGVESVEQTIDEALRILRPNGTFLMANHVLSTHQPFQFIQHQLDRLTVDRYQEHWTRTPIDYLKTKTNILHIKRNRFGILESVYAQKNPN